MDAPGSVTRTFHDTTTELSLVDAVTNIVDFWIKTSAAGIGAVNLITPDNRWETPKGVQFQNHHLGSYTEGHLDTYVGGTKFATAVLDVLALVFEFGNRRHDPLIAALRRLDRLRESAESSTDVTGWVGRYGVRHLHRNRSETEQLATKLLAILAGLPTTGYEPDIERRAAALTKLAELDQINPT